MLRNFFGRNVSIFLLNKPQTICFLDGCQEIKQVLTTAHGLIVVPVVIGALGAGPSANFGEYMKRIGVNVRLEVLQKTALLFVGDSKDTKESAVPVRSTKRQTLDLW